MAKRSRRSQNIRGTRGENNRKSRRGEVPASLDTLEHTPIPKKLPEVVYKTEKQRKYASSIHHNTLTFGIGVAGTGKTFVAAYVAAEILLKKVALYNATRSDGNELLEAPRLICARPAVEACDERLGFLPGDKNEKGDPWFSPIKHELERLLGASYVEYCIKIGRIEFVPFAYMRGKTFSNAIVLLDEAQNTTPSQMYLFLSRIGEDTKVVVDGDPQQMDIKGESGLVHSHGILHCKPSVGSVSFGIDDIVRSDFCKMVLAAYRR